MSRRNLHELPRFADGWTFLYIAKAKLDRHQNGIRITNEEGRVQVPIASLSALLLGPGTTISHDAVVLAGDAGCSIGWCGEQGVRFYASGAGDDRRCDNLLTQIALWADEEERMKVVRRMYSMRFGESLDPSLTVEQIRGKEGVRVRQTYAAMSRETGIKWTGRAYKRGAWADSDPVNRALSAANSCLHALVHSAVNLSGYSEHVGFVHTGKSRAFVYDIADLYKVELTIPLAFRAAQGGSKDIETRVRKACRSGFYQGRLLERVIPDIQRSLGQKKIPVAVFCAQEQEVSHLGLWDPVLGEIDGGTAYGGASGSSQELK